MLSGSVVGYPSDSWASCFKGVGLNKWLFKMP